MKFAMVLLGLLAACGGDSSSSPGGNSADGGDVITPPDELNCSSLVLCTSHDVKRFSVAAETPAGGTITDGTYVLAWEAELAPNSDEGYFSGVEAITISGDQYVGAGFIFEGRGTIATSGTGLTLKKSQSCYLGEEGDPRDSDLEYDYTAEGDRLSLFSTVTSGSDEWVRERVFLRRGASSICETVANEPSTPQSSAQCHVRNCYCHVAVNDTIDPSFCQ